MALMPGTLSFAARLESPRLAGRERSQIVVSRAILPSSLVAPYGTNNRRRFAQAQIQAERDVMLPHPLIASRIASPRAADRPAARKAGAEIAWLPLRRPALDLNGPAAVPFMPLEAEAEERSLFELFQSVAGRYP